MYIFSTKGQIQISSVKSIQNGSSLIFDRVRKVKLKIYQLILWVRKRAPWPQYGQNSLFVLKYSKLVVWKTIEHILMRYVMHWFNIQCIKVCIIVEEYRWPHVRCLMYYSGYCRPDSHPDLLSNQIMKVKVLLTEQEKRRGMIALTLRGA